MSIYFLLLDFITSSSLLIIANNSSHYLMKYQYTKTIQITILSLYSIQNHYTLPYIASIISSFLSPKLIPIISILSFMPTILVYGSWIPQVMVSMAIIALAFFSSSTPLPQSHHYFTPIYLFMVGFVSMSTHQWLRNPHLILFYIILLCKYLKVQSWNYIVQIVRIVIGLQGMILFTQDFGQHRWVLSQQMYGMLVGNSYWHYFGYVGLVVTSEFALIPPTQPYEMEEQMIELEEMGKKKKSESMSNIRENSQKEGAQGSQGEIINLFLVIPFTCFNDKKWQIPIYCYFILTQYSYSKPMLFLLMLGSIFWITADNFTHSTFINLFLRCCMIFMVDKNFQLAINFADVMRIVWLRGSFVIVLGVLFWFGLKTVNVFHLLFIVVVLLFMTKSSEKNMKSFRHRNWHHLVNIFNVFLILRYIYSLYKPTFQIQGVDLLLVLGISYNYDGVSDSLFNLGPLLISAIICVQYWTYNSKIYKNKEANTALESYLAYQQFLEKILNLITLLFYKLIPWVSYGAVIIPLLLTDFSIISTMLVLWILIVFSIQVLYPHSYNSLYRGWLVLSRLTALKIILIYIFSFPKFTQINIHHIPFLSQLQHYQDLLGFTIPNSDTVYIRAITKFQIVISLHFGIIFIAFLVSQYLNTIIRYHELKPQHSSPSNNQPQLEQPLLQPQDNIIIETYEHYIDFKIVKWLEEHHMANLLQNTTKIYLKLYLILIGVYCCYYYSVLMGLCLVVALKFYSDKNSFYYLLYLKSGLAARIRKLANQKEKNQEDIQEEEAQNQMQDKNVEDIKQKLIQIQQQIHTQSIIQHQSLQKYLIAIGCVGMMLVEFSRLLNTEDGRQLIGASRALYMDWVIFISGGTCHSPLPTINFLVMLTMVAIQSKCCRFLFKSNQPEMKVAQQAVVPRCQNQQYMEMQMSILLGVNKLIERGFVVVLVFISILADQNPFAIVYLVCAFLLSYMGTISTVYLSRILFIIIILEYWLMISFFDSPYIYRHAPIEFSQFHVSSFISRHFNKEWAQYLTFGDCLEQRIVMMMSFLVMACYQLYFLIAGWNWSRVVEYLKEEKVLSELQKKIYRFINSIYRYTLIYSPLCITTLCMGLYFMDYTITNFFLSILSIIFLFKSFLVESYTQSRMFWKSYFILLQLLILFFMLTYCILTIPHYHQYCNKLLCSPQQFKTKLTKASLLFILQIGIDLINSHLFEQAMKRLKLTFQEDSHYSSLAIAYKLNDRRIQKKFQIASKKLQLKNDINLVKDFLEQSKHDPTKTFDNPKQIVQQSESWLDIILGFLPEMVDPILLINVHEAKQYIQDQNKFWIQKKDAYSMFELKRINETYIDQFFNQDMMDSQQLVKKIENEIADIDYEADRMERKSFINSKLPMESQQLCKVMINNQIRQSISHIGELESRKDVENLEKKRMLILLVLEAVVSNWHYLTYFLMVLMHLANRGILTTIFPILTFMFGIPHSYQAPKQIWMFSFISLIIPISIKFLIGIEILVNPSQSFIIYLLIGNNVNSLVIQYLVIISILTQCLILKIVGLYDEIPTKIESMKIALIRNIINNPIKQERHKLIQFLSQSQQISESSIESIFSKSQCKPGYDYTTFLVTVQITILIYIFVFYDQMVRSNTANYINMIDYNQFSAGMVIMALVQLVFMLMQRFIGIADLRELSRKWQVSLMLKYGMMVLGISLGFAIVLFVFPIHFGIVDNIYVTIFYVLCSFYFLVSALQVKYGIDQFSRGFMERYTWYNGFVYTGFRAVPFLFEFKVFSDWAVTKTSLRLFDWIKFQQIVGKLYVAKCNSLFMRGKILGSKIEWWKKLLMGYPLLLAIILLLFGPLILFSALNPLASANGINGGSLEMTIKINQTNQYIFYTNSHINNIHSYNNDPFTTQEQQLIKTQDINLPDLQFISFGAFSDQNWEISEGSYKNQLLSSQNSIYEIFLKIKLERNQTGSTPLYTIGYYRLPDDRVQQFKRALKGDFPMKLEKTVISFIRLDNNNGLHEVGEFKNDITFYAKKAEKNEKMYWVIENGIKLKVVSDKYSSAIFGYSVMSFYTSLIFVIANYFRVLFQGSADMIIMSDIPNADPILRLCEGVYEARSKNDVIGEEKLFWVVIDLVRNPDLIKMITGNYLDARIETLPKEQYQMIKKNS